jgi:NAD-dependent deacetylase
MNPVAGASKYIPPAALVQRLGKARRVVALTGAGISAESGVPTFRDAMSGLWARFDPAELATPEAFHRNPRLVWDWYCWRRDAVLAAEPNAGHRALSGFPRLFPEFVLVTQNVDDLHHRAGNEGIIQLHGSIMRARCAERSHFANGWPVCETATADAEQDGVPRCGECGSRMRPDVVWFGEPLPTQALSAATESVAACEVFFSIGTSSQVYPAAGLASLALQRGAVVVEVNPAPTPLSAQATFVLNGPAGEILPALVGSLGEANR